MDDYLLCIKKTSDEIMEIRISNVDAIIIDGVYVRFQRNEIGDYGIIYTSDIASYHRDKLLSWERVGEEFVNAKGSTSV